MIFYLVINFCNQVSNFIELVLLVIGIGYGILLVFIGLVVFLVLVGEVVIELVVVEFRGVVVILVVCVWLVDVGDVFCWLYWLSW